MIKHISFHLKQILLILDQAGNVIVLHGYADETISARCWRNRNKKYWHTGKIIIDYIANILGDPNHCESSYISEKERRDLPPEYRII